MKEISILIGLIAAVSLAAALIGERIWSSCDEMNKKRELLRERGYKYRGGIWSRDHIRIQDKTLKLASKAELYNLLTELDDIADMLHEMRRRRENNERG